MMNTCKVSTQSSTKESSDGCHLKRQSLSASRVTYLHSIGQTLTYCLLTAPASLKRWWSKLTRRPSLAKRAHGSSHCRKGYRLRKNAIQLTMRRRSQICTGSSSWESNWRCLGAKPLLICIESDCILKSEETLITETIKHTKMTNEWRGTWLKPANHFLQSKTNIGQWPLDQTLYSTGEKHRDTQQKEL